jgi:hypothetical protein
MCYNRACSWTIPDSPGRIGGNAFAIFCESKFKYARGWILCRRLKWERGAVSSRVVLLLRSAEAKPLFYRFVQLCWTLLFLSLSSSLVILFRVLVEHFARSAKLGHSFCFVFDLFSFLLSLFLFSALFLRTSSYSSFFVNILIRLALLSS